MIADGQHWLKTPESRWTVAATGIGVVCWAIHASFVGTIGLLLFPLLFGLLLFNATQVHYLIVNRLTLLAVGMTRSEWTGAFLLRASAAVVLSAVFVSPTPEIVRSDDAVFWLTQRSNDPAWDLGHFNIFDLPVLATILMTLLPVAGHQKTKESKWASLTKRFVLWGLLLATIVYLTISSGFVFYLTNVSTSAIKFGFPRSYYYGEFPATENLHDRFAHLAEYQRVTLLVLVSSAWMFLGGCLALGSRRWQLAGVLLWGCAASIALPQLVWLTQIGWKEQFVFKEFDGLPFDLNITALLSLLLPAVLVVASVLGRTIRSVADPRLIRQLMFLSPPLWLFWLVLVVFDWTWASSRHVLSGGSGLAGLAFAIILLLVAADRLVWQRLSTLPKWLGTIHLLLLCASAFLIARPYYDQFNRRSNIGSAEIAILGLNDLLLLAFVVKLINIRSRTKSNDFSSELPSQRYLRDPDLARNLVLVPMFLAGVIVFYVAGSLTLVNYAELWGWLKD